MTDVLMVDRLINVGQILNGFAGPVLMAGPPLLSAIWFPAFQRTTSTSVTIFSMSLGIAASFVVGQSVICLFVFPPNPSVSSI